MIKTLSRYYLKEIIVVLILLGYQNAAAQQTPYSHVKTAAVDTIFSSFEDDMPGCAVGVTDRGKLIFSKGYGSANLDYGIPLRPDSRFMIASISKQFAAASLLMLEQENQLDLDEDVGKYIPELPDYGYPITARQIMHHTSGIRDMFNLLTIGDIGLDNTTTPGQAVTMISRQLNLNFQPGNRYLYSNSGYFLISVLVKNISGMSLREYTEKHFFEPLGMSSTHFHDDTGMIVPNRVISYRPMEYGVGQFYRTNADKVGARGLFTTIEDMALWDRNFIENKTKLKNFNERMTQAGYTRRGHKINYASGLRLEWYRTLKTVGHAGNYMGFRTSYMRFPDHELSVITFCNMSSINPTSYSREVADLYLEEEFTNIYQTYAGQYRNEQSGTNQEVLFEDGDIYLKKGFNHKERLVWKSNNDFKAGHWDVQFKRNRFGQIRSLHIKTPQTGAITFKKVTEL